MSNSQQEGKAMCREYIPQIGVTALFKRSSIGGYIRLSGFLEMPDERSIFVEVVTKDENSDYRVKMSEKLTDNPAWPVIFDEIVTPKTNLRFRECRFEWEGEQMRATLAPEKTQAGVGILRVRIPKLAPAFS